MKVDKVVVSCPFKANPVTKTAAAILTVTAGSLYAASKKDGVNPSDIINEYYKNEFELRNKEYDFKGLSRFTPKEKVEILDKAEYIKMFPKAFWKIVNAKNSDNTPRFNCSDSLKLFDYSAPKIQKYTNVFKMILDEKDINDKARFKMSDCIMLMEHAKIFHDYPKAFSSVLTLKNLSADECLDIMLSSGKKIERNPEILQEALASLGESCDIKTIIQEIDGICAKKEEAIQRAEDEKQKLRAERIRKIEEKIEEKRNERLRRHEEKAEQRAALKAAKLAEKQKAL